jgi:hypothetical protein
MSYEAIAAPGPQPAIIDLVRAVPDDVEVALTEPGRDLGREHVEVTLPDDVVDCPG